MNILSVDPGATRAGWAVLGDHPAPYEGGGEKATYIASEVVHSPKLPNQTFQAYRLELCNYWVDLSHELIEEYKPEVVVTEVVPSRGPEIMDQLYLANVQCTTLHAIAYAYGLKVVQLSARTVQARIAKRKPGVKLTKPQVRDGVIGRLPELTDHLKGCKVFEESDALAVGLCYLKA
jgi:Holliday junction resolvasome RuvABC endonuclease subunit